MSNEEPVNGVGSRRVPRQGIGGSPVGSLLSVILAVVAVVAGFLILRNITDDADAGGSTTGVEPVDSTADTVVAGVDPVVETDTSTSTTTTTLPLVTEGATVAVANANTVGGSAGDMTKTLELRGYTMGAPVDASGPNIDDSIVYYDGGVAAAKDVADSVARDLGGVAVELVPTPPPTESGSLGDAGVLVLLGNNQAGKTLEELAVATTTDATATDPATDPATGAAPDPAGTTGDTVAADPAATDPAAADSTPTDGG